MKQTEQLPNMWINRDYEEIIGADQALPLAQRLQRSGLALFPIWLFLGPRQVGKSSLLRHCAEPERRHINLDDLTIRQRANLDPELFLSAYGDEPICIDEIQYAPKLLPILKRRADAQATRAGQIWLTGSQSFEVMQGVRETLAGRVAILNLFGLSDHEKGDHYRTTVEYFAGITETTLPKLYHVRNTEAQALYLSSYIETYLLRDVQELIEIKKRREFEVFLKMCALRTGQIIDYDSLGRDVGVSPNTIKEWLGVLKASFIIHLVYPYYINRSKRLIKRPKLFFNDMGLAAFLAGWRDAEMLRLGPMGGAALETHMFGEIMRFFKHRARDVQCHFWRTRDGQEIDLLIEVQGKVFPLEIKMGFPNAKTLPKLHTIAEPNWQPGQVLTLLAPEQKSSTATKRAITKTPLTQEWQLVRLLDPHFDLASLFVSNK